MKVYQSINESKIHVIHHGIDGNLNRSSKSPNNNINSQFILYVGHREGYKNFEFILPVMAELRKITQDKVSCSRYQIYQFGNSNDCQYQLKSDIINLGQISDDHLGMLYSQCLAFAYTSLYEGFGYPLIEAMSRGAIPIALHVSCIPEVLGTAGVLVKPDCKHSIAKNFAKLIEEDDYREKLKMKSLHRSKVFSF